MKGIFNAFDRCFSVDKANANYFPGLTIIYEKSNMSNKSEHCTQSMLHVILALE